MIRTLKSGQCRLYSRKINPKTGKRRNLGTFTTRAKAEKHELPGGLDRINPPAGATTSPDSWRAAPIVGVHLPIVEIEAGTTTCTRHPHQSVLGSLLGWTRVDCTPDGAAHIVGYEEGAILCKGDCGRPAPDLSAPRPGYPEARHEVFV